MWSPWKLTCRSLLWHLLDAHGLMVLVLAQTKLCLQRVAIIILTQDKYYYRSKRLSLGGNVGTGV